MPPPDDLKGPSIQKLGSPFSQGENEDRSSLHTIKFTKKMEKRRDELRDEKRQPLEALDDIVGKEESRS